MVKNISRAHLLDAIVSQEHNTCLLLARKCGNTADLYNITGLRVLLKKCPKNDVVIRGPFTQDDDR